MLAHETVLRQRYSLGFLTTTLLITLTTQSSLAFNIVPPLTKIEIETYTLPDQRDGFTGLSPVNIKSLTLGGTAGFLTTLKNKFPTWTFNSAPNDLAGSFNIQKYVAVGTPTGVGAEFQLEYIPGSGDPSLSNSLHWIQRVVNNHSVGTLHNNEMVDIIDNLSSPINPFYPYDTESGPFRSFYDFPYRSDADNNHYWLANLYLVNETAPNQVTIYNGIEWGWENLVEPVPEPLTIFGSGMSLGLGVLFKKYSTKHKKTKISTS